MKLLVNTPRGIQEVIEVNEGGGYFDSSLVLWDERDHGALPEITLGGMVRSGDSLVFDQGRKDSNDAVSNADDKAELIKAAISNYNDSLKALEEAYPQKERDTWPQQVTEARAYQASDQAATPLIDAMLTTKTGTTKTELVGKIMTNYTAYSALVGAALGQMQTTLDGLA